MKKICMTLALAGGVFIDPHVSYAQYASAVLSYTPGSGVNTSFENSSAALGAPALGAAVTPFAPPFSSSQIVGVGAGGEITLQMSSPIVNNPSDPYGLNFILFGNSFFQEGSSKTVTGLFDHNPTMTVQVSADDSTWYALNPALAPEGGTLYPTSGGGNPQVPVNPALTLNSFIGQNLAGINSLYNGSAGGTGYNLAWAQDANGNSVNLTSVNYVQVDVQSGLLYLDAVSEVSAVPEPKVWMLILLGIGGLWLGSRRQTPSLVKIVAGLVLATSVSTLSSKAVTISENFTANPAQDGWQVYGDTNLFGWDSTNQNLDVTWDSSQPNSYFYHSLGTILTTNDNFTLAFDLELNAAEADGYGFELAIGLVNLGQATNSDFIRGTSVNSPDLVELDYYPDVGFGPTVWPIFADTNSSFNWNSESDYAIYAPNLGDWYHIQMTYTASNLTMVTTMTNFEGTSGIEIDDPINLTNTAYSTGMEFADYRVDTFSISSYNDAESGGSIYAQGVIDNIVLTVPPPPVQNLAGSLTNAEWQAEFTSQEDWTYVLQRTVDFASWTNVSPPVIATGPNEILTDPNPPLNQAFYRVSASRP